MGRGVKALELHHEELVVITSWTLEGRLVERKKCAVPLRCVPTGVLGDCVLFRVQVEAFDKYWLDLRALLHPDTTFIYEILENKRRK